MVTFSFVLVAITTSLWGTYYLYLNSNEVLLNQIYGHLETAANSRANHVETYMEQNIERLKLVTSRTALRESLKSYNLTGNREELAKITKIIKDAKEPVGEFERICVVGLDGVVLASTNENFCGRNVGSEGFFAAGLKENGIWFVEEGGEKKIFVAGPFTLGGEVIGMGITVVGISVLEEIVGERPGLGETGEVLIAVLEKGERLYLAKRRFEEQAVPQAVESEQSAEPMKAALRGEELLFEDTLDYREKHVIAVSRFVETGGIGLVAKIDLDEPYGIHRERIFNASLVVIFSVVFFAGLAGFLLSRMISGPIERLTSKVESITKGKLDISLEKSGVAEINSLIGSLNRVLASMKLAILRTGLTKKDIGIEEAVAAKEEAEERYRILFESSKDAIMTLEPPSWKFTSANPATLEMFGAKTEKEFTDRSPWEFSPKKQPDGQFSSAKAKKMIERAMESGSNFFEWTHKRLDGEEFPATVLLTRFKIGRKKAVQATVRDLTKMEEEGRAFKRK
jgi:PAS domain S-box-containing protein